MRTWDPSHRVSEGLSDRTLSGVRSFVDTGGRDHNLTDSLRDTDEVIILALKRLYRRDCRSRAGSYTGGQTLPSVPEPPQYVTSWICTSTPSGSVKYSSGVPPFAPPRSSIRMLT